ncbi:hypothetical protein [Ornithinimicrobium kibberense]
MQASEPAVRSSGGRLFVAVQQLSTALDEGFIHLGAEPARVLAAYAAQHDPQGCA